MTCYPWWWSSRTLLWKGTTAVLVLTGVFKLYKSSTAAATDHLQVATSLYSTANLARPATSLALLNLQKEKVHNNGFGLNQPLFKVLYIEIMMKPGPSNKRGKSIVIQSDFWTYVLSTCSCFKVFFSCLRAALSTDFSFTIASALTFFI